MGSKTQNHISAQAKTNDAPAITPKGHSKWNIFHWEPKAAHAENDTYSVNLFQIGDKISDEMKTVQLYGKKGLDLYDMITQFSLGGWFKREHFEALAKMLDFKRREMDMFLNTMTDIKRLQKVPGDSAALQNFCTGIEFDLGTLSTQGLKKDRDALSEKYENGVFIYTEFLTANKILLSWLFAKGNSMPLQEVAGNLKNRETPEEMAMSMQLGENLRFTKEGAEKLVAVMRSAGILSSIECISRICVQHDSAEILNARPHTTVKDDRAMLRLEFGAHGVRLYDEIMSTWIFDRMHKNRELEPITLANKIRTRNTAKTVMFMRDNFMLEHISMESELSARRLRGILMNDGLHTGYGDEKMRADFAARVALFRKFGDAGLDAYRMLCADNGIEKTEIAWRLGISESKMRRIGDFMKKNGIVVPVHEIEEGPQAVDINMAELAILKNIKLLEGKFGEDGARLYRAILEKMDELAGSADQADLVGKIVSGLRLDVNFANTALDFMFERGML
jgi:hypothetical protein